MRCFEFGAALRRGWFSCTPIPLIPTFSPRRRGIRLPRLYRSGCGDSPVTAGETKSQSKHTNANP